MSADSTWDFSPVASSLLNRLNTEDVIGDWTFDLKRKGEAVLMERDLEMKEVVDGEEAARRAARRMRCLLFQSALIQAEERGCIDTYMIASEESNG